MSTGDPGAGPAYRIELAPRAARQLRKLPRPIQQRLAPHIDALAADPRPPGCIALEGEPDTYRIRVGDYRILYEVRDRVLLVLVLRIGHRRDVYRGT